MYTEKRNLRPYILGLCFFWGIVAGFIAYRTSETAAQAQTREIAAQQRAEADRAQNIAPKEVVKAPEFNTAGTAPAPHDDLTNALNEINRAAPPDDLIAAARSRDFRSIPAATPARLRADFGLNVHTTPRPVKPESPRNPVYQNDKSAAINSPPSPTKPLTAERNTELPLPDLTDIE